MNSHTQKDIVALHCFSAHFFFLFSKRILQLKNEKKKQGIKFDEHENCQIGIDTYIEYTSCGRRLDVMNVEMAITFIFCSFFFLSSICAISSLSLTARLLPTRKFIFMSILVVSSVLMIHSSCRTIFKWQSKMGKNEPNAIVFTMEFY